MAKKQKRRSPPSLHGWKLPQPTPGDHVNMPDRNEHLLDLIRRYAKRTAAMRRTPQSAGALTEAFFAWYTDLYKQYVGKLMNLPEYLSEDQIDKLDRIDIRELSFDRSDAELTAGLLAYLKGLPDLTYAGIPCFEEGALYLTQDRVICFKLESIDLESGRIEVTLRDYVRAAPGADLSPGVSGTVSIDASLESDDEIRIVTGISPDTSETFAEMYTKIPPKDLGWSQDDADLWRRTIVQNAVDQNARFADKGQNPIQSLSQLFHNAMVLANYFLSSQRPKLERASPAEKPCGSLRRTTKASHDETIRDPDQPRIRSVGMIRFMSRKPPRPSGGGGIVRKYTVASWTARGHTRRYKNGKTVYVRPAVHHRKALAGKLDGQTPAQSIVRLYDNAPKGGDPVGSID